MESKGVMKLLEVADPSKQESLIAVNTPDPMDAEQTWPNEEEIKIAQEEVCLPFILILFFFFNKFN